MHQQRLRRFFESSKADALVLHNGDSHGSLDPNYFYYTGLELDNSVLVARRNGKHAILCTPLNRELAKRKGGFRIVEFTRGEPESQIKSLLRGCEAVGVHKRSMRVSTYERLRKSGLSFIDVSDELADARAVKDAHELALIRKSVRAAKKILDSTEVRVGMSELDILKQLKSMALEAGAELSFPPIVLSGPNARVPHGVPGKRRIGRNEVVLVDFGLKLEGYCSDLTRCYFTGACKKEREIYDKLKAIQRELRDYGKAGIKISDFVKKLDYLLKKSKLPQMPHSLGHGIGLEVHEAPLLFKGSKQKLERGMVLAIEPSYYSKKFGLRYENEFMIGANGLRAL